MDFNNLIQTKAYDFLRTDSRLKDRVMLLGVCGSYGYGTNREGSDVDLRGIALNPVSDILGLTEFEQFEDRTTDTVIYSFRKLVRLLLNCNPNAIEILGLDSDQYVVKSVFGQELLDHTMLFLSKRVASSFCHYADTQLRKLQNAVARDKLPQPEREAHILRSAGHVLEDYNRRFQEQGPGVRLYVADAVTEGLEKELFLEGHIAQYPLRKWFALMDSLHAVVRNYDTGGSRNHTKDTNHLQKHAMHLVRLLMMGIDILEHAEIRTHRPESDLRLLREIRDGAYMQDGVPTPEFYEIVADYENLFAEASEHSLLPDNPDMQAVETFVEHINRQAVSEEGR